MSQEIKDRERYMSPMDEAKAHFKELKRQIKIGEAMIKAAEGSSASRKKAKKESEL